MCTSKCGGFCISLLKDKLIDSKQSLVELSNLLDNLTVCGVPAGTDTNNFMAEVNNLKMEARRLLDEVDHQAESKDGKTINLPGYIESIFEEFSFKERLNELKQKIHGLSHQQDVLK
jgi:hypothetical protein